MVDDNLMSVPDMARVLGVARQSVQERIKRAIDTDVPVKYRKVGRGFLYDVGTLPDDMQKDLSSAREAAIEKVKQLKPKAGTDIDFEKELWSAADRLRGNIDASEYKHIVLGLLFLKYVSDAFNQRRDELRERISDSKDKEYVRDEKAREIILNDKDQYLGHGVAFVPEKARWEYLREFAMQDSIAKKIEQAMDELEAANPKQLQGVLPKDRYLRTTLEPHVLGELVNIFSRIRFDHNFDKEKDMLGRVYEYFIGQFASEEGKRGGEFYTPTSLVKLLVGILEPFENARIFDPACGSGGMFVQSSKFLEAHKQNPTHIALYGQESNPTTYKLCRMNLAIRGIYGDVQVGNSYYDDKFPQLRADFVLANPPFNAEWDPKRLPEKDARLIIGTPPSSNANFMWIQHFVHHLAPGGMAGFVMANGALAVGGREGDLRKKLIEADLVDVIVACPPKLFYNVALPVSLWFLAKNKKGDRFRKRAGETLFIDAREKFAQISRKQVEFSVEHIKEITDTVRAWRGAKDAPKYKDVPGFCKAATLDEIGKAGYVLTPGRYVGLPDEEDDGVPFEEKMRKLSTELRDAFKQSDDLEKQIISNLKKITL
jgi:type I restriction enzyme M protein